MTVHNTARLSSWKPWYLSDLVLAFSSIYDGLFFNEDTRAKEDRVKQRAARPCFNQREVNKLMKHWPSCQTAKCTDEGCPCRTQGLKVVLA